MYTYIYITIYYSLTKFVRMIWTVKNFMFLIFSVISYLVFTGSAYPSSLPLWIVVGISRVNFQQNTDAEATLGEREGSS